MRLRRRWHVLLLSLTAFFAAALILLYSETALRWGVYLVTDMLVKPLAIGEVHGRLAGPFTLAEIDYKDANIQLSLEELAVDWKPSKLFFATAQVTELRAKGLSIEQFQSAAEATPAKEPFALPQIGFPLKLIVEEATLDQIILKRPGQTEPLIIKRLALQAETSLNTLKLHRLSLDSDWLQLAVSGSIRPRQDYQSDLTFDWTLPQQNASHWQGKGTIRGNIKNLLLQQQLASPFAATLELNAHELLGELTWQGKLEVPRVASSQLPYPISPPFSMGVVLKAQGDIRSLTATSEFAGEVDSVGPVKGSVDAAFANQRLHITRLLITQPEYPSRIEAKGDITFAEPLRYQMQTQWKNLTWPLETPTIESNSGLLNISGENDRYQFDGGFHLAGVQIPKGEWQLQGSGDTGTVTVNSLNGNTLDGMISGNTTLKLAPHLSWEAQLNGKSLNPAVKWTLLPGRITFNAWVRGQLPKKGLEMEVALPSLSGTLRGRELQGKSEGVWRHSVGSLNFFELKVGSARLSARGKLTEDLDFNWQVDAGNLADLLPQARGTLKGDGNITGPVATPRLSLRLDGKALAFADYHAEQLHTDITLDLRQQVPSSLTVRIEQLQIPGIPLQTVMLNAKGPLEDHRITLDSSSAKQSLNLGATAGYTEGRWAGKLNRLQIDDESLGQWVLAKTTTFSLSANNVDLDEFCLTRAEANLCAAGQWATTSGLSASLSSAGFPLQLLRPYLPRRFVIDGELDGKAVLAIESGRPPHLEGNLALGQGSFTLLDPETESEVLSLIYRGITMQLGTSAAGAMDGEIVLSLSESDRIVFNLQTSLARGWPDRPMQHPLKARLTASLRELSFISSLIPEVQNVQGAFDADVSLSGTLGSPRLNGDARLEDGQLNIPRMGLTISALKLTATGDNARQMDITGYARSGDGDLTVSGRLMPAKTGAWALELAIVGKRFEVARIPEARMQISPNMTVRIVGREIRLEGELDIPDARLEPPDISRAVKTSDDVVIVSEGEPEEERELWRIHTHVRMTASDSIRFIGYGFDGRIGGDLLLIDEPGSLSRARGELRVVPGSTYTAFGQKLSIERGKLNFADSPVDNPNLDIRAFRKVGDVVAGINVSGTAQRPVLTLYSEPPMDQADILSYLTLGHPMNTAGQGDGETLAGAANTAGLVGGNYLAGYIGKQFGLEEARVEAGPGTQSPWVVVGKYLSPRLYVRYGVGVYEDAYSVIVRYQLTEHWMVQGEGGQSSGADILYIFERP